jgi:hypothetical protein
MAKATFNLASRTSITAACCFDDLDAWLATEIAAIDDAVIRSVVSQVCKNLNHFVRWPSQAVLLWQGCDRIAEKGAKAKYHRYPERIKTLAKKTGITLDTRPNGPAIAAFLLAGGDRPGRHGSLNAWSIHHLYSGKFPFVERDSTTHAPRSGLHFTQSAGLIATHPIADAICDEFPAFAWRLRAESFKLFGYDPDGVFSNRRDELGFATGHRCTVVCNGD